MDNHTEWSTNSSTHSHYNEEKYLSWIDYILFSLTLFTTFLIGIYFGCAKNKARTTVEYLLGGKSMSFLPIALSLVATQLSNTTLIAVPADIYKFGANHVWTLLSDVLAFVITLVIFLPVYYNLQLVSIFEYLELRFDKKIRRLTSVLHLIYMFSQCPIVIYLPALVFSQVTGLGIYPTAVIITAMCILYTTIGGFKGVVWTDVLQCFIMISSLITILIIGNKSVSGFTEAVKVAREHKRLDIYDFSVDLTSRYTFWAPFIGNLFFTLSIVSVNQNCIQKYLALPSSKDIKRCILIHLIGYIIIQATVLLIGIIAFARYAECDVFKSKILTRTDQLMPYFVMDITANLPGLPGLFVAGVFSAALSSLSSALNGTAASIHRDLISPFISENTTMKKNTNIIKVVVIILGVVFLLLALVVEKVGGVFPFTTALRGVSGGPMLGIFILGLLFPRANAKGALVGALSGIIFTGWILFGNMWYKTHNLLPNDEKPTSIEKCTFYNNQTIKSVQIEHDVFILYRICFWYYTVISAVIVISVGYVTSCLTKKHNIKTDPQLISSAVHCFLPKEFIPAIYYNVNTAEKDAFKKCVEYYN